MKFISLCKAAGVGCTLLAANVVSSAQTFTTLANFTDGSSTFSAIVQGRDGNLYGTSPNGSTKSDGTVFKVTPTGALSTIYTFCSQANCADGLFPVGALRLGIDGNFYGTTQNGGASGLGTVFKITPSGVLTVLHSFGGADGSYPDAGLALGTDGSFYGTTSYGGAANPCLGQCGTVFKVTALGTLTTLHSFDSSDGNGPFAPLVQGTDGNFYGTTLLGGTSNACNLGCGTVFKISSGGIFT